MQTETATAHPAMTTPLVQAEPAEIAFGTGSDEMDDFIYLISHDVRASVRALLELPHWIKEDLEEAGISTSGAVGNSIELMNRHTGRLDRMLVDLLSYSRVGRMQTMDTLSLNDVLDDVLEQMAVPVGFKITRDLQCDTIKLGERDLPLLLSALINNAIKHHDRETGAIHISAVQSDDTVTLSVADDGAGIEEKFHARVFSPMTTLRPRDEVEGSGMGLAKVQKIARHYGGSASITASAFGKGTCVEVVLNGSPLS